MLINHTAGEKLILSGSRDGTAPFMVDDWVQVKVTHWSKDDEPIKTVSWEHDFSNFCRGAITPHPPEDLTHLLSSQPQTVNRVDIVFGDFCGDRQGNSDIYLNGSIGSASPSPVTPSIPGPTPTPPAPTPAQPLRYVAMGDSYHSGEGAPPFEYNTTWLADNLCHRSFNAAAVQFANNPGRGVQRLELKHVACSGAKIDNLVKPQFRNEWPQVDALTKDTRLVTLSIGGNDVGFVPVLLTCHGLPVCVIPDRPFVERKISTLGTRLDAVFSMIKQRSPQARIMIVGYPHLFGGGLFCKTKVMPHDRRWIDQTVDRGDKQIRQAAERNGVTYVDIVPVFKGHGVCDKDPWINNLVAPVPFESVWEHANRSFHPTNRGQTAIADVLRRAYSFTP